MSDRAIVYAIRFTLIAVLVIFWVFMARWAISWWHA